MTVTSNSLAIREKLSKTVIQKKSALTLVKTSQCVEVQACCLTVSSFCSLLLHTSISDEVFQLTICTVPFFKKTTSTILTLRTQRMHKNERHMRIFSLALYAN